MAVQAGVIYGNDDGNESKVASRTVGISVIWGTAAGSYVVAVSGLLAARTGERIHLVDALHTFASFCTDIGASQPLAVSCSCSGMLEMITVPNPQALESVGETAVWLQVKPRKS